MIKLKIKIDENYIIESFKKYRRQHSFRNAALILKILFTLIFISLTIVSVVHEEYKLVFFFCVAILVMLFGYKIDHYLIKRRIRKSPHFNDYVDIHISETEYLENSSKSELKAQWGIFTKAVVFQDGFLLMQGTRLFQWLPIKNIVQGSTMELNNLLKGNIKNYRVIEQSA